KEFICRNGYFWFVIKVDRIEKASVRSPKNRTNHMKYAILVYETPEDFANREQQMSAYNAYSEALSKAGLLTGGAALQPGEMSTTVRIIAGDRQVQDGPFADTKEQLGGFLIIQVDNLDQALEWAARCPAASNCAVEVRPLLPMNQSSAQ
ncbi:MAG: YciI family protein, partial [Cyanobacteria bacterium P01_C01_bin.121]